VNNLVFIGAHCGTGLGSFNLQPPSNLTNQYDHSSAAFFNA
jgi:hypothetical protein